MLPAWKTGTAQRCELAHACVNRWHTTPTDYDILTSNGNEDAVREKSEVISLHRWAAPLILNWAFWRPGRE